MSLEEQSAAIAERLGRFPVKVIARDLGLREHQVYYVAANLKKSVNIRTPQLLKDARAALEGAGFTRYQINAVLRG